MLSYHDMKIQKPNNTITHLLGIWLSLWLNLSNSAPILPQASIDTTYLAPTGNVITVKAGDNFQVALNKASLGDTIIMQANATFNGPFILPNKTTGLGWIYIRSSNYSSLPLPNNRVAPSDAANMPKIVIGSKTGSAIQTANNAHHYRFIGIEFKPMPDQFVQSLVTVGNEETSAGMLPHDIIFDRCYIHGDPAVGGRRGVAMDGANVAVIDSYVSDFKESGADTQALWAYNSPGPLKIANNYLEAAGENLMLGGADPKVTNLIPSDIEIKRNYFFKPLSWMSSTWSVKNLLEFKNAQRVLVEGNFFENNWPSSQDGFSVLFTPRNQDNKTPWTVVQDITFQLNTLTNLGQGINILGRDDINTSQISQRLLIKNNVINITGLGGAIGRVFQITGGVKDLTIDHNTVFNTATAENTAFGMLDIFPPDDQFVFSNNLLSRGVYGFFGSGKGEGMAALKHYCTHWQFTANAIIGTNAKSLYPKNNFFPADIKAVGFMNYAAGDYHLTASSPYKKAGSDGKDLGADIDAIMDISTNVSSAAQTLSRIKN